MISHHWLANYRCDNNSVTMCKECKICVSLTPLHKVFLRNELENNLEAY